jgi:hypothetical protein
VRIPLPASRAAAASTAAATPAPAAPALVSETSLPPAAAPPPPPREPVSERQAESTALLPAASPTGNGDATDYGVRADNTVIVQPGETLGHFADWARIPSATLRSLNKLHKNAMVTVGHKVKLDLSNVSADEFTKARRDYHRQLQDDFFATHKIAATET